MPFTFAYMVALLVWVFATCAIWSAAALMCVTARTRPFAWPTALAATVVFPFVLAYQILVAPVVLALLFGAVAIGKFLEPEARGATEHPVVIGAFLTVVVVSFVLMVIVSVAGFIDGWRTGWGLARRHSLLIMLSDTIPMRLIGRYRRREL